MSQHVSPSIHPAHNTLVSNEHAFSGSCRQYTSFKWTYFLSVSSQKQQVEGACPRATLTRGSASVEGPEQDIHHHVLQWPNRSAQVCYARRVGNGVGRSGRMGNGAGRVGPGGVENGVGRSGRMGNGGCSDRCSMWWINVFIILGDIYIYVIVLFII
jgi:hypothetical protein